MIFPIRFIAATIILSVSVSPARPDPQDLESFRAAANELSEELITCGAFYMISSIGFEQKGTPKFLERAKQMKVQADHALEFAAVIFSKSRK